VGHLAHFGLVLQIEEHEYLGGDVGERVVTLKNEDGLGGRVVCEEVHAPLHEVARLAQALLLGHEVGERLLVVDVLAVHDDAVRLVENLVFGDGLEEGAAEHADHL